MQISASSNKIHDLNSLLALTSQWKKENQKIVFTNGCFDIVHLGHIDYLEKARFLGDKLVVGLNTDDSIRKLKGSERPIVNEQARLRMLAAYQFVDAVVLFDEPTPLNLIQNILPEVLVKGKDYNISNIVGADIVMANGGKVETIELVEGYSTSGIIEKIKRIS